MEKKNIILLIIILALSILAGLADGTRDTLAFHYTSSIFPRGDGEYLLGAGESFWNPDISWRNKWKNGDPEQGERFLGSSTFLDWTTDGWHLFQFIMLTAFQLAIALPLIMLLRLKWWWLLLAVIPLKLGFSLGFAIMFSWLLLRRGAQA